VTTHRRRTRPSILSLSLWDELQSSPETLQTDPIIQDGRARIPDVRAWFVLLLTRRILNVADQTINDTRSKEQTRMTTRVFTFLYGALSYAIFLATFLYAIGFVGNFAVPKSMDSTATGSTQFALIVDLGLLALFAVQHSVMARPAFKRVITRILPATIERSTYVLASSAALLFLFWQWKPLGGSVWKIQGMAGRLALYFGFASGWLLVLAATFAISHFDLFGLRQVWRHLMGQPQADLRFATPFLYRIVRHPLYVGWFLAFWCTPTMTATHLFFAFMTTAYILIAIRLEERDLMKVHPQYADYRERVPMLVPGLAKHAVNFPVADATVAQK
jgi:protein-S-isoprenylcysteine O-methyltransferase Ste14